MSRPGNAETRIIQGLKAGLDPRDEDIDEFHDELDGISSAPPDACPSELPRIIYASQVSTWYKRAGIEEYLQDSSRAWVLSLVKMPTESGEATDAAAQAIWDAAANVVQVGERIIGHSDTCIREEAAKTHQHRDPRKPLEALQDIDTLQSYAEPWQRVLMFFVRTQMASDNRGGLRYQFTQQQKNAWDRLWQAALDHKGSEEETSTFRVNPLQLACLQFCVELLNQHYRSSPLECALVCALAALGHDSDCWLSWRSYADLLAKAIRIAQSFVVQHTLLSGSDSEDLFEDMERKKAGDSWGEVACELPSEFDKQGLTRSEWLYSWLKTTTTVGTKSPMDWMIRIASGDI